jgi:hypothetical protein
MERKPGADAAIQGALPAPQTPHAAELLEERLEITDSTANLSSQAISDDYHEMYGLYAFHPASWSSPNFVR